MGKRIRKPIKQGFCTSSNSNPSSYIECIKNAHEYNKEELKELINKLPKIPYVKIFGKLMQISHADAERIKNDINVIYI